MIQGEMQADEATQGRRYFMRERRLGRYERTSTAPTVVDADGTEAGFENSVVALTVSTSETAKPKRIPMRAAGPASPS